MPALNHPDISARLKAEIEKKRLLIAAHRGKSGGNILGNTIPGFKAALQEGADILEMDVVQSIDGIFYVFHDGTEPFHLKIAKNIKTLSSKKISKLHYFNATNKKSEFGVQKLEDVLEEFKGRTFINIDRAWDIFPQLIDKLEAFDMKDQIIIKAPVKTEVLRFLNETAVDFMFMPIIHRFADMDKVLQYQHINLVGMELVTPKQDDPLFENGTISRIKERGLFAWVNAVTFNEDNILYGGLDDNTSIIEGPDQGWGKLMDKGFDVILTDWTALLYQYRKNRIGIT